MELIKDDHQHKSITERWNELDAYFECITECDINDQNCVTRCLVGHLQIENGA